MAQAASNIYRYISPDDIRAVEPQAAVTPSGDSQPPGAQVDATSSPQAMAAQDDAIRTRLEALHARWLTPEEAAQFRAENNRAFDWLRLQYLHDHHGRPWDASRRQVNEEFPEAVLQLRAGDGHPIVEGRIQVKPGPDGLENALAERFRLGSQGRLQGDRTYPSRFLEGSYCNTALAMVADAPLNKARFAEAGATDWLNVRDQLKDQKIRNAQDFPAQNICTLQDYADRLFAQGRSRQLRSYACSIALWSLLVGLSLAVLVPSIQTLLHKTGGTNPMKASFGYLSPKDATVFASVSGTLAGISALAIAYRSYQIHRVRHSTSQPLVGDELNLPVRPDRWAQIADSLPDRSTLLSLGYHRWSIQPSQAVGNLVMAFVALAALSTLLAVTRPWSQESSLLTSGKGYMIALGAGLGAGLIISAVPVLGGRQSFYQKFSDSYDRLPWPLRVLTSLTTVVGVGLLLGYAPAVGGGLLGGLFAHHLVHRLRQRGVGAHNDLRRELEPARGGAVAAEEWRQNVQPHLAGRERLQNYLTGRQVVYLRQDVKCALAWTVLLGITATVLVVLAKQVKLPPLDKRNMAPWLAARRHLNHLQIFAGLSGAAAGVAFLSAIFKGLELRSRSYAQRVSNYLAPVDFEPLSTTA
jgi:hypothetical protein